MSLGENIKNKRNELKLSQEYIAEQLGVSRQAVSKWETDQSEPTASNLIQLAQLFEISLSELVEPVKYAEKQEKIPEKQNKKWLYLILLAVVVLLGAAVLFLVRAKKQEPVNSENTNETVSIDATKETDDAAEEIITFELAYFKEGEEYQLSGLPWGTSFDELKAMLPPSYELIEEPIERTIEGQKVYLSLTDCLLKGKSVSPVYTFLYDELVEIQLVFSTEENAEELFEPIVTELTDLFGPESEKSEEEQLGELSYIWQTDSTRLEINSIAYGEKM